MVGNLFRKLRNKTPSPGDQEDGYVPPKPAHRWQRRKRQEEEADRKRQELVTLNKVNPWFQANTNPRGQEAIVVSAFPGGMQDNDLECRQGDILTVESADRTGAWWQAVNTRTGKTGYVPANFVTEEPGVEGLLDAWHDIDRRESEARLDMEGLPNGTYIVRPSSSENIVYLCPSYVTKQHKQCRG